MSFQIFGLAGELLRAIAEEGYVEPTQVQQQAIPIVLSGRDMLAGSQTGTGKTAGFTLPLLHRLAANPKKKSPRQVRALILTPTRELAAQVGESVAVYGKYLPLTSAIVFGGVGIHPQVQRLSKGVDVLIATPGRLLDHVMQKTVDLSRVEVLVLDEADRMLDMGFIHDIRKILSLLPKERQNLFFSATFSEEVRGLAEGLLVSPKFIEATQRNTHAPKIKQSVLLVDKNKKPELLAKLFHENKWQQVLVFVRMKHGANRLVEQLQKMGVNCLAIHGNKSQSARTKALSDFKKGEIRALVATDIAARGLDIEQLPHVVNYELPNVPEDYVHRIGRTGRAGCEGEALSLVCIDEHQLLKDIEKFIKTPLARKVVPGFEPDLSIRPEPLFQRRHNPPARHRRKPRN